MAIVTVALHPIHVVEVTENEIELARPGAYTSHNPRGVQKVVNFEVHCHTCRWSSPSRFMARRAAEVIGSEHQEAENDVGVLWLDVVGWEVDLGDGLRVIRRL